MPQNTKAESHFWQEEYFNGNDDDTECTRVTYQGHPFHIVVIKEEIYVITDNVCSCLSLDDYSSVDYLSRIPVSCKAVRTLCKSNRKEYKVALINEEGLCILVGLVNTPEAYSFLHDVQDIIRAVNAPATGAYARIAERFARAKRKRIEANPSLLKSSELVNSRFLSQPAYYARLLLNKEEAVPASVLTLDASVSLDVYQDKQGNFWFDSRDVLKAIGQSPVADPASIFMDVPSCWLADLPADDEGRVIPCILLQGLLFYLSSSTNLTTVYLMYYVALRISISYNRKNEAESQRVDRPVPVAWSNRFSNDVKVRYTVDASNQLWYVLPDIEEACNLKIDSDLLQTVPEAFVSCKLFYDEKSKTGQASLMCITEQGLWFLLAKCPHTSLVTTLITRLSSNLPCYEDQMSLYKHLTEWRWPYISHKSEIPPYDEQLRGLETILTASRKKDLPEWVLWGLDVVAEATTGISPLSIIKRWQGNIEKKRKLEEES